MKVEKAIEFLNELVELDGDTMHALVGQRVPCNAEMAEHPTVQVGLSSQGGYEVGFLGILNGLFGVREDGWGYITAIFDEDGDLVEFIKTVERPEEAYYG